MFSLHIVVESDDQTIRPQVTQLDKDSAFLARHRTIWHLKAVERMERLTESDMAYSAPLTISHKDFLEVKEELLALINQIGKRVKVSQAEELVVLNIDWISLLHKPAKGD